MEILREYFRPLKEKYNRKLNTDQGCVFKGQLAPGELYTQANRLKKRKSFQAIQNGGESESSEDGKK